LTQKETTQNTDIEALAKGGRTNVLGFFVRLIARIPFLFIGGQWYGADALGRLAFAIVVVEFAAQLATMGLKRGLALHLSVQDQDRGKVWDALLITLLATVPPTILIMAFPQIMFPNSAVNGLDYMIAIAIPALALSDVMLAALAYRFDIKATVRARAVLEPWTISIVAFGLAWVTLRDGLLIAYATSVVVAFLASLIPFLQSYGLPRAWRPHWGEIKTLAVRNAPLAAADAIEWGSRRLDLAVLGLFVSPATVGIYWAAQQVASLPQKLKTSFDPILAPVITRKLEEGDRPAVARQLAQVGFWILAAQVGIALALGITVEGVMGLIGPKSSFVGGSGALVFLLVAEVAASVAVVSEAALVYIARHRNLMISLSMIGVQMVLTIALIFGMKAHGYPELYQAAAPGIALTLALAMSSILKVRLAQKLLGAPINVWRWALVWAGIAAGSIGSLSTRAPEWVELSLGIPTILIVYGLIIWRWGFQKADRVLFQKKV
jgi:O-antigen/teichoic acid export membrane protein